MDIKLFRTLLAIGMVSVIPACAIVPPTNVQQPMTARPQPQYVQQAALNQGGIYQPLQSRSGLFDDRRARNVGDILTIHIAETTSASKKASSKISRSSSTAYNVPLIAKLPGKFAQSGALAASGSNSFDAKGEEASGNSLITDLTVTVTEVLSNGNLVVSGEKQIGIGPGTEYLRFSGVVDPSTIVNNNTVPSSKVADARVEYKGSGYIDENLTMGWLARFFLNVLPF